MAELGALTRQVHRNRAAHQHPFPMLAVAIPIRNEMERIVRCIDALDAQEDALGSPLVAGLMHLVLLTNGCTDGTYPMLLQRLDRWSTAITVIDITLPLAQCNAGFARYLANHAALNLLSPEGCFLFMTDADSCTPPRWVITYMAMLRSGYDAVAGAVDLHKDDCSEILAPLRHRCELEDRYATLLDELESWIDPVDHDPWPRHFSASGANLALRVEAIPRIGDFPRAACGEDKLLADALEAQGCRVRHDCETKVHTSGRLFGRAIGGMAETLRRRIKEPSTLCDERLERAEHALLRASLRRALREAFVLGVPSPQALANTLKRFGLDVPACEASAPHLGFEGFWREFERRHPQLARRAIAPGVLAAEIEHAERLLEKVRTPGWSSAAMCKEEQYA